MDPVQTSHLRQFANAIAVALARRDTPAAQLAAHAGGLSLAVHRSTQFWTFMNTPAAADTPRAGDAASVSVVAVAAHAGAPAPAGADTVGAPHAAALTPAPAAALAAGTRRRRAKAGAFFSGLPWAGAAAPSTGDQAAAAPAAEQPGRQQVAGPFFSGLPWSSSRQARRLSIGDGSQHPALLRELAQRTGRLSAPDAARARPATSFFALVPWGRTSSTKPLTN